MNAGTYSKFASLVRELHDKTMAGKIEWAESSDRAAIVAHVGSYSLRIQEESSDFSEPDIFVTVVDANSGKTVDRFSDVDLSENVPQPTTSGWFSYLSDIISTARRQISGAEAALDDVLSKLRSI